jgi:hypothetical protein
LENPFVYEGAATTEHAASAVDTPIGGEAWVDPTNVLTSGLYASVTLSGGGGNSLASDTSTGSSVGGGVPWTDPTNIDSAVSFASVSLSPGGGGGSTNYNSSSQYAYVNFFANGANPSPPPVYSSILNGLPSVAASTCTLYVTLEGNISTYEGGGALELAYTVNGGGTWETFWGTSSVGSFSGVVASIPVSAITNIDQIQIRLEAAGGCSPAGTVTVNGQIEGWYVTVTTGGGGGEVAEVLQAAISGLSVPAGAVITGLEVSFQGDYTGVSPTCQVQLNVGSAEPSFALTATPATYTSGGNGTLWGYGSWTNATLSSLLVNFYVSSTGTTTVNLNTLVVTVFYSLTASSSDALDVTTFGYSLASISAPQGLSVTFPGYATALPSTVTAQLLKAGVPVGAAKGVVLTETTTPITLGGVNDLWGTTWSYSDLNNTSFGVRFEASSGGSATIYVGYVAITAYFTPSTANFNYVTTFEDDFGDIETLALDADGQWWGEDVIGNEGVLTPLFTTASGSFASSFTADSRQFIAISDLLQGTYPPQGYNLQWNDRVSQVGAGAPPAFAGTLATGATVTLTAYSTAGGVVTLTGVNTFTAGEVVVFSIASGPTYLNGGSYNVLGTGLSGTQFEVAYIGASGSGSVTGTATGQYTYPIVASPNGITQFPFWNAAQGYQSQLDDILWSAGAGSTDAGTVVTIYYLNSVAHPTGQDANLATLFQQQLFPVYVYVSGTSMAVANGTQLVTGVGIGTPPGGGANRFYFTFNVSSSSYLNLGGGSNAQPGQYQLTVATVNTTLPLPGVQTGDQLTLSENTVSEWNETWTVLEALNSGSFSVNQTSVAGGVATYDMAYTGTTSTPPIVGQLITVTGCLNPAANFDVTDAVITGVSWSGGTGTVQVSGFTVPDAATPVVEVAQATTSGTSFYIDPGPLTLGAFGNPIYGNSGSGYITLVGSASIVVGTGTRRGVVFFITRNGYYTAPSPYFQFNIVENTNYILATNIPIGAPDVIARGIAFTEGGQDGVPGASYYTIPTPVTFTLNGVNYLSSSLFINDNVTTTAKFTFPDTVLLEAEEIDIQGNDLFALQELGDSAWCTQYAGRSVWGRVNNKVGNFLNMSFDGGYLPNPGGNLLPLGWGLDPSNLSNSLPTLLVSPVFGNSYYIKNQTGSTQAQLGMITQGAYQDQNNVAILQNSIAYSVRVTCRTPSSATTGSLVVDLTAFNAGSGYGQTYGTFTLPCANMTSNMVTYTGTLLITNTLTIPSDLVLRVWASGLLDGGDIEIDRVEVYPTLNPVNYTGITFSYKNDWESFDAITGGNNTSVVNSQPANGAFTMHDILYVVKESSLGEFKDSPNQEPANWNPYHEVSNVAGASGINAFDVGEEWAVMACENGLFAFNGGAPVPIQLEIPDIWGMINWKYGQTVVVRNDTENRRIYIAAPIATPNAYMPLAPANSNPTTPNIIMMLNYKGIGTIEQLISAEPLHVTLMGKVVSNDLRRKWSAWTIPCPYLAIIKRSELDSEMVFCNGVGSSKLYVLGSPTSGDDDGVPFTSSYCTYGMVSTEIEKSNPTYGCFLKRFVYASFILTGSATTGSILDNQANGIVQMTFYQNTLNAPYPWAVPGGCDLSDPQNNFETTMDEYAMRIFTEVSVTGGWFNLSRETLTIQQDGWAPVRGKNGV